jgi:REP element-mobilizing transposase RayT
MARKLRNFAQGMTHHCYTRCHAKKDLMKSSHCIKFFKESIRLAQEKYNFELIAAEPVGNHIHIIIKTFHDDETISRIMQFIKSRVAEMYNKNTGCTGAFWNERFSNKIIEEADDPQDYLMRLLWYIGYNPVKKLLSRNPRENSFGFINIYLNKNYIHCMKFTRHSYFYKLGNTFEECVEEFLEYEKKYLQRMAEKQ